MEVRKLKSSTSIFLWIATCANNALANKNVCQGLKANKR
jgi:hypothetical protein